MARSVNIWAATALVLAIAAPEAQAQVRYPRHHVHHRQVVANVPGAAAVRGPNDIMVHARQRSYLDPGPPAWNEVGTGDRYASDSTPYSPLDYRGLGSEFGLGGFETLPTRFNPPGRPEPIWEFSEP